MGEYLSPPSIEDSFRELDERIADIVIGPAPAWQTPALENGWVGYGGGFANAQYMKDMIGLVHLRGMIRSGTNELPIFTLPVGFRPFARELFGTRDAAGGARLDVLSNGQVFPFVANNAFLSLSGISFLAER